MGFDFSACSIDTILTLAKKNYRDAVENGTIKKSNKKSSVKQHNKKKKALNTNVIDEHIEI